MISYSNWILLWTAIALCIFPVVLLIPAPYGRHIRTGWGSTMSNHWGWFIMESPVLILVPTLYYFGHQSKSLVSTLFVAAFTIHYINRVFIYPLRINTRGKRIPLSIVLFAFIFNLINGFNIGYYFGSIHSYAYDWLLDPRCLIGLSLFLSGMYINHKSDSILIRLRAPGEVGYKMPNGFLFKYISCPNHFGEIIEWIGFAIMTWSLPGASFAIWTVANLLPRSLNHHKWYKLTMDEYPDSRKAIFPFLL